MKKTILYPQLFACLSLLFFLAGCEREEFVSERIALNALEVQLSVTRAYSADDPTLTTPNSRRNWVLEVQIEESNTEDYIFSEQDEVWIPKNKPAYFPASINNDGCNVTFTLRPPYSPNGAIGQNGSAAGLLEADTLRNTVKLKPQGSIYAVALAHVNSLIEIVLDTSIENKVVEIETEDINIRLYSAGNGSCLGIVPNGSSSMILKTKVSEEDHRYVVLNVAAGVEPNTRYLFIINDIAYSPVISPWSDVTGSVATMTDMKEFIHIEGYTGIVSLCFSGNSVRLYPHPDSKEGEGIYYFPSTLGDDVLINSIQLERYSKNILIGRHSDEQNIIKLKVDSEGKLLLRKQENKIAPISVVGEMQLINTEPGLHYKQEADIDFSCLPEKQWTPIGSFESPFKGVYDGNGYKINHLDLDIKGYLPRNSEHLEGGPKMSNGHVVKYYWALPIKTVGLFGVNNGTINNVHIASGTISVSEIERENEATVAFGAICGYSDGGRITNCVNNALMQIHMIAQPADFMTSYDFFTVGGICGTSRGNIENCINYGNIIAEKGVFAHLLIGGICGNLYSRYKTDKIQINSCINHGNLLFNDLSFDFETEGLGYGGISGMMHYYPYKKDDLNDNIQKIVNCYNTGNAIERGILETKGELAGIVAMMFYPLSTYSGKISSCYSIGKVKVNSANRDWFLDPLIGLIVELYDPANNPKDPVNASKDSINPFRLFIENCFYSATAWEKVRFHNDACYFPQWEREVLLDEELEYIKMVNKKILEATPAFSQDSWPDEKLWDANIWRDLGSWNNGNPIYPKLRFEKD
ncbi:MAG: hypothetical protein LBV64_06650 [Mediterranea sp.]|jgi:hypothetical protein|nr:hypothetical protein [Mediterranea sp.]